MLKCKHCKQSEFGSEVIEVRKIAAYVKDGEIIKFDDGEGQVEIVSREIIPRHCVICNTPVTPDDLYEMETCSHCHRDFDTLVDDYGICQECYDKAMKKLEARKRQLLFDMLNEDGDTKEDKQEKETKKGTRKGNKKNKAEEKLKEIEKNVEPELIEEDDMLAEVSASDGDIDLNDIDNIDTDDLDIYADDDEIF